jgi:putative spermidine/putrescine transport system ATP-binding protein
MMQKLQETNNWLEIVNLNKTYKDFTAVDHVSLNIKRGEFMTFLGSSGSGKSTTLLSIAGFLEPTSGEILFSGQSVLKKPPHKRNIGMVFQQYSLFPHMTIFENIAFPLKMRKLPKPEIMQRVNEILNLIEMEKFQRRMPHELSGGQQQRVALARALVFRPDILLMDEPLAALDKKLRETMQLEIRRLHKQLGLTIIYVTHDQEEALKMSDRIAIFNHGAIEQIGTPLELYDRPKTKFVAEFLGDSNVFHGKVTNSQANHISVCNLKGEHLLAYSDQKYVKDDNVAVMIRPEKLSIEKEKQEHGTSLEVKVVESIFLGDKYHYKLKSATGDTVIVKKQITLIGEQNLEIGDTVYVTWKPENAIVIAS